MQNLSFWFAITDMISKKRLTHPPIIIKEWCRLRKNILRQKLHDFDQNEATANDIKKVKREEQPNFDEFEYDNFDQGDDFLSDDEPLSLLNSKIDLNELEKGPIDDASNKKLK